MKMHLWLEVNGPESNLLNPARRMQSMTCGVHKIKSIWEEPLMVVFGGMSLWKMVCALKRLFRCKNAFHAVFGVEFVVLASIMRMVSSLFLDHCWINVVRSVRIC